MPNLEMDTRLVDLKPVTRAGLLFTPPAAVSQLLNGRQVAASLEAAGTPITMSYVFIDGAGGAHSGDDTIGPAASGMCVIHELSNGQLLFGGYAGALVVQLWAHAMSHSVCVCFPFAFACRCEQNFKVVSLRGLGIDSWR